MQFFEEKKLTDYPIVVLDTETTGLFPGLGHRVTEIGAVRFENWEEIGRINQLINPQRKIEPKAAQISGITDEAVADQPTFANVAGELAEFVDGALLVAHNAPFDANFIGLEMWLAGQYDQSATHDPILPNPWLCTLQLARRYFHFGRNNLSHVAGKLGVRPRKAHRALNDVYMTADILKRMSRELRLQRMYTVGDLLYAQGDAIYTPAPPRITLPDPITTAIAEKHDISILYVAEEQTQRRVTPLYATQHKGVSYLIAHCHLRNDQRSFRLDRIFSASAVE